jgi:hypothetical protein
VSDGAPADASGSEAAYVLPLRWREPGPIGELAAYLRALGESGLLAEVLVVDGSPPTLYESHAEAFRGIATHLPPHADLAFPMGKVNGVITGVRECSCERVVIADDDVRYEPAALARTLALLGGADLVRPQNYFAELPWHARWDTARSLLNRVFTGDPDFPVGDVPGTLAVRRDTFLRSGAYDGRAMFENLELMRTIAAAGGTVVTPLDLYVARKAPSSEHFFSQRVRQAYDDFAIPARIGAFLAIAPGAAALLRGGKGRHLLLATLATIGLAELGRRRANGAERFPLSGALLAPAWVGERSICAWLALAAKLRGGVPYGGRRLAHSAGSMRSLRRRYASGARAAPVPGGDSSRAPLGA